MPFPQEEESLWTRKEEDDTPYGDSPYAVYQQSPSTNVRQLTEAVPASSSLQHSTSTPFEIQAANLQYPSYPLPTTASHYPSYPPSSWPRPWEPYASIHHQHPPPPHPMEAYRYPEGVYRYTHSPHPMHSPPQSLPIPRQQLFPPPLPQNSNHPYFDQTPPQQQFLISPHFHHQEQPHQSKQAFVTASSHHHPSFVYLPSNPQPKDLLVYDIREEDVLCGRGAPSNLHAGNIFFRRLVDQHKPEYLASRRSEKPLIATKIIELVRERGGRFLTRTKSTRLGQAGRFGWKDIGEQKSYEKACQALRENAPEIRRQQFAAKHNEQQRRQLAAISIDDSHSQSGDVNTAAAASSSLQVKGNDKGKNTNQSIDRSIRFTFHS